MAKNEITPTIADKARSICNAISLNVEIGSKRKPRQWQSIEFADAIPRGGVIVGVGCNRSGERKGNELADHRCILTSPGMSCPAGVGVREEIEALRG